MAGSIGRRDVLLGIGGTAGTAALSGCGRVEGSILPDVVLPGLPGLAGPNGWPMPGLAAGDFRRGVSLLNVWATWCSPCREEHSHLLRLSQDRRFRKVGIVYKDRPGRAADFVRHAGNPYDAVAVDDGRLTWGLGETAVPVSYVVDRTGRVALKFRGALDEGWIARRLMPAVQAALEGRVGAG